MPEDALDRYRLERFVLIRVRSDAERAAYDVFLREHYESLGFLCTKVLPSARSMLFMLRHGADLAAIFRLTPIEDPCSPFYAHVPGARRADGRARRLLEVNNVVIDRSYRASIALALILYRSACEAHAGGYDFIVGLNRLQILRFFVDFGVVPVDHAPVHVLGKPHLKDFINYYDTGDAASIAYMHERARRYFHQELVMRSLRQKYAATTAACPAPA
jgi:hypothetical protein